MEITSLHGLLKFHSYAIRTESVMPQNGIGAVHFIAMQNEVMVKKESDKVYFRFHSNAYSY